MQPLPCGRPPKSWCVGVTSGPPEGGIGLFVLKKKKVQLLEDSRTWVLDRHPAPRRPSHLGSGVSAVSTHEALPTHVKSGAKEYALKRRRLVKLREGEVRQVTVQAPCPLSETFPDATLGRLSCWRQETTNDATRRKELEEAVAELELLREEEDLVGFATTFDEEAELVPPELPRPEPTALPQQVRRRLRGKQRVRKTPPPTFATQRSRMPSLDTYWQHHPVQCVWPARTKAHFKALARAMSRRWLCRLIPLL